MYETNILDDERRLHACLEKSPHYQREKITCSVCVSSFPIYDRRQSTCMHVSVHIHLAYCTSRGNIHALGFLFFSRFRENTYNQRILPIRDNGEINMSTFTGYV